MKVKSKYLFTTNLVHRLVALFLGPGEKAIDATMGKGKGYIVFSSNSRS